jgi:hypothetical protein
LQSGIFQWKMPLCRVIAAKSGIESAGGRVAGVSNFGEPERFRL